MNADRAAAVKALDEILLAGRLQQAVSVAAALGVPDVLAEGPRSAGEIAGFLGAHEDTLYRLLGTLAAAGILHEEPDRRFRLTEEGDLLRSDVPDSRRDWAVLNGQAYVREAWSNLEHSVRTGENAFAALHGESVWSWRRSRPDEQARFDRTMAANSGRVARAVAEAFDFAGFGTLVDVGGGTGTLLAAVLNRHPGVRGVVFDQPEVARGERTRALLEREGVADRVDIVGGDFFESIPPGADAYLLKSILHDWEDAECIRILRAIHDAALASSKLLVVELVVGPPNEDLATRVSDLHMLVVPGGRERSEADWRRVFEQGGFELEEIRPTASPFRIIVGSRR